MSVVSFNKTISSVARALKNISCCMVKFDKQAVIDILPIEESVEITVSGRLTDGTRFEGSDTIRVIDK